MLSGSGGLSWVTVIVDRTDKLSLFFERPCLRFDLDAAADLFQRPRNDHHVLARELLHDRMIERRELSVSVRLQDHQIDRLPRRLRRLRHPRLPLIDARSASHSFGRSPT